MRNILTQLFIGIILLVIIIFYYQTEVKPFEYQGFENNITLFQRHDAQLNEAIVQTQFGLIKHYDSITESLYNLHEVIDKFYQPLTIHPNPELKQAINELNTTLQQKEQLIQSFQRYNPILQNAIQDFSLLIGRIIEAEAHLELIESCLQQEYRYFLIDMVNNLFRGILIYINTPTSEQRQDLLALIQTIKEEPDTLPNLELVLNYAEMVLNIQPEITDVTQKLVELPIADKLKQVDNVYSELYLGYSNKLENSRFFLYFLSTLLLIIVHFAFKRLQGMVTRLKTEIELKKVAEQELAQINKQLEQRVTERTKDLAAKNEDLQSALGTLKETQDQLVMQEKMASVGMLTTGIAHEIKNPLNFINNFSDISVSLVDELKEEMDKEKEQLTQDTSEVIYEVIQDLKTNCAKIHEHGQRADNIVKNMLLHSEGANMQKEMVQVHNLIEENMSLAVKNMTAQNPNFKVNLEKDWDKQVKKSLIAPQGISRVILYLLSNSFYTVDEKLNKGKIKDFEPTVKISTILETDNNNILIKIWDNGMGISEENLNKIFDPFFTTKPTGRGNTGLGLSICYDLAAKQHGGDLTVNSKVDEFTEFTIKIPLKTKK